MANQQYQEDKMSILHQGVKTVGFFLNPLNAYLYDPNMWDIWSGQVKYNAKGLGYHLGKIGYHILGKPQWMTNLKKGISGFGVPGTGWIGAAGFNSPDLFAIYDTEGNRVRSKAFQQFEPLRREYLNTGVMLSRKEYNEKYTQSKIKKRLKAQLDVVEKGGYIKTPEGIESSYKTGVVDTSYNAYQSAVALDSFDYSEQRMILRGKMAAIRSGSEVITDEAKAELSVLSRSIRSTYGKQAAGIGLKLGLRGLVAVGKLSAFVSTAMLAADAVKMVATPVVQGGIQAVDNVFSNFTTAGRTELGGSLNYGYLSQGAATERQRAIQAISKSRINGRSLFGQEAQYMHS